MLRATHAVTINAPPEQIWPWLVQRGYRCAGWYSAGGRARDRRQGHALRLAAGQSRREQAELFHLRAARRGSA